MSYDDLATALGEIAARNGERKQTYTQQTLLNWENGRTVPSSDDLDSLLGLAVEMECGDIVFYSWPSYFNPVFRLRPWNS